MYGGRIMKTMKGILAAILCSGMMVSSFDFSMIRAEGMNTHGSGSVLAFTSDVHNKVNNIAADRLSSWINMVAGKYGRIDYMGFCGDMAAASAAEDDYWDYTQEVIDTVDEKGIRACYTTGNHEFKPGNYVLTSNPAKDHFTVNGKGGEGQDFFIYCLGTQNLDYGTNYYESDQAADLLNDLKYIGNDRVIIVLTHYPLHSYSSPSKTRRVKNADLVIDALNEVVSNGTADPSDDRTVVLLWGHNHTLSDPHYDNVYTPGNSLIFSTSENSKEILFYYASAGCMSDSEYSSGSANINGKGLVITIKDNQPDFAYYDASGNNVTEGINYPPAPVTVTGVSLDTAEAAVETGSTVRLNAAVAPDNASFKDVQWSSSDETVAAVTDNGVVKGLAAGNAVIRVTGAENEEVYAECTVTVKDPVKPVISTVTDTGNGIQITWNKVEEAAKYRLYRKTGSGSWAKLTDTTSTTYTDKNAETGMTYSYRLRCIDSEGTVCSKYSEEKSLKFMALPVISTVTNTGAGLQVTWNKVEGAAKYRLYRKTESGSWAKLTDTKSTTYTDNTVQTGTTYAYRLRCIDSEGAVCSKYSAAKSLKFMAVPVISKAANTADGVSLTWKKVTGAVRYRVYKKTGTGSWKKLTDTDTLTYTDKAVTSGTVYSYRLRALNSSGEVISSYSEVKNITFVTAPKLTDRVNVVSGIRITWTKVTGAAKYQVYRKSGSNSWTLIGTATKVSYTDKNVQNGVQYRYRVRSVVADNSVSVYSNAEYRTCVGRPAISGLTNSAVGKMTVKWSKIAKASGYQIQYSTSSAFASGNKTVLVTGETAVSKVIASLTKGKTYYVRVRAYRTVSGAKVWSAWSGTETVKIKK